MATAVTPLFAAARNRIHTFRTAALSYIEHGGEAKYLDPIMEYLDERPLDEIVPFDVRQMAADLYPDASNATRNRQGISPARAVLNHGYDRGWCPLMRIRNFKTERPKPKVPASAVWMFAFLRQCQIDNLPHLAALVLFMNQTGARISEARRLCWPEVDLARRTATLIKTKTSTFSVRHLTDEMVARISALPHDADMPVFRYRSRWSVNERMREVCRRAAITYKSPHVVGRHSFATNALAGGIDIASAMEAGDWKSVEVFVGIYAHPVNAGRRVADQFNEMRYDASL